MQESKCFSNCIVDSLIGKRKEKCLLGSELLATLEDKLQTLENHFSKTEVDCFRKIRDLRNVLGQRTRKQQVLGVEVSYLREEFSRHQLEIGKLTEQILAETEKEPPPKKTSSPPALLKKSLDGQKVRLSPNLPSNNTSFGKNSNELNYSKQMGIKVAKKGYSPTNSSKKLVHMFPSNSIKGTEKESVKVSNKTQQTLINQQNESKYIRQKDNEPKSPQPVKKKAYSPKSNAEIKGLLLNSLKSFDEEKPEPPLTNYSPKRLIRNSPTTKAKQPKKALGHLKESEEFEAF